MAVSVSTKITPFFVLNGKAEEAVDFYTSIFSNAKIVDTMRCTDQGPGPEGSVLAITFEIEGQRFAAMNFGPQEDFTMAISFLVDCSSQEEVDRLWNGFAKEGQPIQCGWIKDKYGITWQIVPTRLKEMLKDEDSAKAAKVMQAMHQMVKLDINSLEQTYNNS